MRLALLLLPLAISAQTTVPWNMLRLGDKDEPAKLRLFAVGLSGMVQVQVGPGLRMALVDGVPTLTADPVPMQIISKVLTRDANGNYPCPRCQRVYRAGIRMAKGVDYETNANGILPKQPWAAEDVVLGEWIGVEEPVVARGIPCSDWWRAPGCCNDPTDVKDCPDFDKLKPPRFGD